MAKLTKTDKELLITMLGEIMVTLTTSINYDDREPFDEIDLVEGKLNDIESLLINI